jgi:peptidylprolyl isomerase
MLLVVPLALVAALVAGCGASSSSGGTSSAPPSAAGTAAGPGLPVVAGGFGTKPTVTIPKTAAPTTLKTAVLHAGTGPKITKGQLVAIDYLGEIWTSKKVFDTSFDKARTPAAFPIGSGQVIVGFDQGLVGRTVGSRVLLVIPPALGYGSQGNSQAGIAGTDTLVFVVDVLGSHDGDASAKGTPAAALGADLPAVSTAVGKPTITLPKGTPPTTLVTKTVVTGTGDTVRSGDLLVVQYVGVKWADGKTFDSSWQRGVPAGFGIGVGQVIKGWDDGLVGHKVGDRVLLVVPPSEGYGAQGQSQAGISGTDTLVFAVDIVGTYH